MSESPDRFRYPDWKAPAADGEVLVWPDPPRLLAETRDNNRTLTAADSVRIQNVPLPELRRATRSWIGVADESQPIIGTGHQAELYHPGVWAKDALTNAAS